MKRSNMFIIVAIMTFSLLFAPALYEFLSSRTGVNLTNNVEVFSAALEGLKLKDCGRYNVSPDENTIRFSGEFNDEVRCFLLFIRKSDEQAIYNPKVELVIEPANNSTPYRYYLTVGYFRMISSGVLSSGFNEFYAVGQAVRREGVPPGWPANDNVYVIFTFKPAKQDGFPVKINIVFKFSDKPETPKYGTFTRTETKEASNFTDIREYMKYKGYEPCGEFFINDTDTVQIIRFKTVIDLNVGKACFILIHPPAGKTFLVVSALHLIESFMGDNDQISKYVGGTEKGVPKALLYTPFLVSEANGWLGRGRTIYSGDVPRPFEEREFIDYFGQKMENNIEMNERSPLLVFFAYKGDSEVIGEPFRFNMTVITEVNLYVIPAKYGG
jgi:hypothetical protein